MIRSNSQNKILHWQLGKLNISSEVKEDLVYQYTNGRETRSNGMTPEECQALINHLNLLIKELRAKPHPDPLQRRGSETERGDDPANRMRRKVLSICHEMGWKQLNGKIDMNRVNDFCVKRGYLHKELNFYVTGELPKLITQFEKVLKEFYAKR